MLLDSKICPERDPFRWGFSRYTLLWMAGLISWVVRASSLSLEFLNTRNLSSSLKKGWVCNFEIHYKWSSIQDGFLREFFFFSYWIILYFLICILKNMRVYKSVQISLRLWLNKATCVFECVCLHYRTVQSLFFSVCTGLLREKAMQCFANWVDQWMSKEPRLGNSILDRWISILDIYIWIYFLNGFCRRITITEFL